jgi:hypothetical protein
MKKINPVNKYDLRSALLKIPGVWICKKGYYISIEDLNKAIDDLEALDKETLVNYIFERTDRRDTNDMELEEDLDKLLSYNEVREYIGMKPLNGHDEYLEV